MPKLSNPVKEAVKRCWQPKPVTRPTVEPSLQDLHPLTRSAEAIVFSILSVEFWMSPNGQVREWLRHNSRIAVVLAIPVFLVLPVVTFGLHQLVAWMSALNSIAGKLIILPVLTLVAAIALGIVAHVLKLIFSNKK